MIRYGLAVFLALLPLCALAQDEAAAPAAKSSPYKYAKFDAKDFGFSIALPTTGEVTTPEDSSWTWYWSAETTYSSGEIEKAKGKVTISDEDPEVAFTWYRSEDEPVVLIQGRVDKFETELDAETFRIFCETLLANWSGDNAIVSHSESTVQSQGDKTTVDTKTTIRSGSAGKYTVVTANEKLDLNGLVWNLIEVEDASDSSGTMVYYSVFSTFAGSNIYTISMYYLEPVSDSVQEFGFPVLDGFKLVTQ